MKEQLGTIGDLTAERAAGLAREIWFNPGEGKVARQLLYYALKKDKRCADGLMLLVRYSDSFLEIPVAVSAAEYALNTVAGE